MIIFNIFFNRFWIIKNLLFLLIFFNFSLNYTKSNIIIIHSKNKESINKTNNIINENKEKINKDIIKNSFIKPKKRNSGIVSRIIKEDLENINKDILNELNIENYKIDENKKFDSEIEIIKKEIEYPIWFEKKTYNSITKKDFKKKMKEIEEIALKYGKIGLCDNLINNKNFNNSNFLYYISDKDGICHINTFTKNKKWEKIETDEFLELEKKEKKYLFKFLINTESNEIYYTLIKKININCEEFYMGIGLNINNPYIYINYLNDKIKEIIKNKNIEELKILINNEKLPIKNIFPFNALLIEKDEFEKEDLKKDILKKIEDIKIKNDFIEMIEKNNGKYIETKNFDSYKIINYGKRIIIKNKENNSIKFYYFLISLMANISEYEIINNLIDINKNIYNQDIDNYKKNNINQNILNFDFLNKNILNKFINTIIFKNNNIIYSKNNNIDYINILNNYELKEGINFIDLENENFIIYKKFNFKKENINDNYIFLNLINPSSKIYKSYNFLKKIINEIETNDISKFALNFYSNKINIPYSWLKIDIYDKDKRLILSNHETDKLWNKFDKKGQLKNKIIPNKILLRELNNKEYLIYKIEKNEPEITKENNIKNNFKDLIILISW